MPNQLSDEFPIHWAIWHNDLDALKGHLSKLEVSITDIDSNGASSSPRNELERKDPRGRTPLMLAVTLGHFECAKLLLDCKVGLWHLAYRLRADSNADANAENRAYWCVVHEATATGDPELLRLVLHHRAYQRTVRAALAFRRLLNQLKDGPDFYAEIDWKFGSWVPFVTQMCPSDTYKVYKSGSRVRIDTTLAGLNASAMDSTTAAASASSQGGSYWQRADLSYRFSFDVDESGRSVPAVSLVDHERRIVQVMPTLDDDDLNNVLNSANNAVATDSIFRESRPSASEVSARLTSAITTTYVDIDRIAFERCKQNGLMSWFTTVNEGRRDVINGYDCSVCSASNVELVTKTRSEHLSEQDKRANEEMNKSSGYVAGFNVMELLFGKEQQSSPPPLHAECVTASNPFGISADEYFNSYVDLGSRDIGRPKELTRRSNTFKATLWLAESFPLDLQEQVMPIIDLMASSNAHFARLKNFISLQLPAGFPVRIELPLFHVFTSEVTFGNVQAAQKPVQGVSVIRDETGAGKDVCVIDDSVFAVDPSYERIVMGDTPSGAAAAGRNQTGGRLHVPGWGGADEEDVMLQLAIQQSLMQQHSDTGEQRTGKCKQPTVDSLPAWLAIFMSDGGAATLRVLYNVDSMFQPDAAVAQVSVLRDEDQLLQQIMAQSLSEQSQRAAQEQEELDELQRVLELSKLDM